MIKSWNMYKSIIYIKDGQHIGPLLGLNVVQYIKPLTNLKNAQGSPKSGLRRSAIAILRLYCRFKTDVKIIIQSRDLAGRFCYSLPKSKRFCTFDIASRRTKVKRSCGELGCTPFLAHHGPKNSLRFSTHFCGLEKIGANNAPKNCSTQFLLAHILLTK